MTHLKPFGGKPIVAYQVDRDDWEGSVVVFGNHFFAVRRKGASMLDCEEEYCHVSRAKEFDQYVEKGFVPVKALLEAGWWIHSAHDGVRLDESVDNLEADFDECEDGMYIEEDLVFSLDEKSVWKNWEEMERHAHFINDALIRKAWFTEAVKVAYPQFTFTEVWGGPHHITHTAFFDFPGSRYKGNVMWDWDENEVPSVQDFRCYVCQGDQEALDKYLQSLV